jgi:gliding motility-associated-like protein
LLSNYITVFPAPIASASATANEYDLFVDYIDVINNSTGGSTYIWSLEGTYLGNMDNVQYPITDSGSYSFHLVVISDKGCMDSTDVTVYVKPGYALYFPNAFTPNNDGSNDVYMPVGYGISEFEMLIYDRWGELVFRTTDLYTGWDGRYNGKAPFSDVYVYKVRIRDLQLNPHYFIGKVTLVH